jgi:hypothetical protein
MHLVPHQPRSFLILNSQFQSKFLTDESLEISLGRVERLHLHLGLLPEENAAGPGGTVGLVDPHDSKLRDAGCVSIAETAEGGGGSGGGYDR